MTLFIVFSDSHGDIDAAEKVINQYPQATKILHLGDYVSDAMILQNKFPEKEIVMVNGNSDGFNYRGSIPDERILEAEGKRILMVHGHRFSVKSELDRLAKYAQQKEIDLTLFGHTHIAIDTDEFGSRMLNPGSISYPNGSAFPSYALLEIGHGMIETRIMNVR